MRQMRGLAFALIGMTAAMSQAQAGAIPLAPGQTVNAFGVGSLSAYEVLGSETSHLTTGPLAGTTVFSEVIAQKVNGVYDTSHLDFVYVVTPPASDVNGLMTLNIESFKGVTTTTAVEFLGPGNYKPISATRSSNGIQVGWGFTPVTKKPAAPYTEMLVIETNSSTYAANGHAQLKLGAPGSTLSPAGLVFAPSAVPEPGTLLLGCGALPLLAFCYIRNRRGAASLEA